MSVFEKMFGSHSDHELKRIAPIVKKIEGMRDEMMALSDEELQAKTPWFKERLANGETLDDILPEAFAVVREASRRVLHMEHFPVQLMGGIVLHQGRIAEMKTGEGKTLVATCPAYLNALEGKGVHIVTVNDYLAQRDADEMGQVHRFLGLTVGCILNDMKSEERQEAYGCDITYVTNNEDGFDYLRDNMVIYKEQLVQRDLNFVIIDEVDSILIDEARTPLIISGQSSKSTRLYEACDILARQMVRGEASQEFSKMDAIMGIEIEETGDYIVSEKEKTVNLTNQELSFTDLVEKVFGSERTIKSVCLLSKYTSTNGRNARAVKLFAESFAVQFGIQPALITTKEEVRPSANKNFAESDRKWYERMKKSVKGVEKSVDDLKTIHDRYYKVVRTDGRTEWWVLTGELDSLRFENDNPRIREDVTISEKGTVKEMTFAQIRQSGIPENVVKLMEAL